MSPQKRQKPNDPAIILVIDDMALMNESLVEGLSRQGYPAIGALNAREAQRIVATTPSLRVLLCDICLGDENGPDLIRQILRTRKDLMVIFMSGGFENVRFRSTDPFLKKPFDLKTLARTIENVLLSKPDSTLNQTPLVGDRRRTGTD